MEKPNRKHTRLTGYDYNMPGYYFITTCTKGRQKLLSDIVGTGVPDGPQIHYTAYGDIVRHRLDEMSDFYDDVKLDKYVVMPNHVHLLIHILDFGNGPAKTSVPANTKIARFISTFKRLTNRECHTELWQSRSHDHIVRGEKDYQKIWEYIDTNPIRWADDCFYC